ncbi:MAG: hypothetical protein QGH45_03865 [Myxococcota bacterium]|jgi:hypothetical protein|nr:hypothetical protein [Myxococcota bacterium]
MSRAKNIAVEVIQFAPILTLASTFVVSGEVDLERAATLFVVAAAEAVVITGLLAALRQPLNPILLGANLWLGVGALAFGLSIEPLAALVSRIRAGGLFGCALVVGVLLTAFAPRGYVGVELRDRGTQRRGSVLMLVLTAIALVWSAAFVDNIRLGGGLPFIALNVSRRMLARRLR